MAKTTKKTTKVTAKEKTVTSSSKEPVKKITTEPEKKKITAKPEAMKITASKEPAKIAASKEPEKIAVKPEPKKLVMTEPVTSDTKEVKAVKEKKVTKKTSEAKAEVVSDKKKTTKKAVVKKETVKKETTKKAPAKKATKKVVKEDTSTANIEKMMQYTLEECIDFLHAMGVMHTYDDYKKILMDESDFTVVEKNIVEGNQLTGKVFDFTKDGYDIDLIKVTLTKIADTMDIKASDYETIKQEVLASTKAQNSNDDDKNAKEYLAEFKLAEKILMIAQRKNITASNEVSELIGADIDAFVLHFFDFAYEILPTWKFDDVKFYEDFAYAILSQYADLYEKYQLRILIDCADLYIKHGDFLHGDESYRYILRDNQIKDYIYYRYASVYETIDINKAKGLAYESLQYVDDRYTYYPNIMEILNK